MAIPPAVESVLSDPARVLPMQRAWSILTDISGRILIRVAVRLLLDPPPYFSPQKGAMYGPEPNRENYRYGSQD